ncbi:alanine--tRNA ligase [Candidatus Daviesbacteria bacterium]|nr:alanine--tRNA ligase [Candidatus Daviesbacteria bacterium]
MTSREVRKKFLEFFKKKDHVEIEPARLVLEDDPTTLFTSSGMQPLVPFLTGEKSHPRGVRLVDSQPSFRAEDIDEVGDNRHTTFFEMLGNWSLGDYFKKEQLPWIWEFLTVDLGLPKDKLYVTVFEGDKGIPKDEESFEIWKGLGVSKDHIHFYGVSKNWWSRSGPPEKMPTGEIGGPDSEVFYEFTQVEHDLKYGQTCHPNCDCGRFLEIANSVFIQYQKQEDGSLKELDQKNVDFGGGLERLTAATNNSPDLFETDLFSDARKKLLEVNLVNSPESVSGIRIVLDHLRASIFIIDAGVEPSNKEQGYVLRRLIRRAALYAKIGNIDLLNGNFQLVVSEFVRVYADIYPSTSQNKSQIVKIIEDELVKFEKTLEVGMKKIISRKSQSPISGSEAFDFYQTYGFPPELIKEFASVDLEGFEEAMKKHQDRSRSASAGMFKGGLAGHSQIEIKYHTTTHLLHQALRDVLGPEVFQKGSNITEERLRFDFSFERKLSEQEIKQVEDKVNQKIKEDLKVDRRFMTYEEAKALNAIGLFDEKYDKSNVSIYAIGPNYKYDPKAKDRRDRGGYYSLEFCGGPHVEQTGVIGGIKITKQEAISAGIRRIRAVLI